MKIYKKCFDTDFGAMRQLTLLNLPISSSKSIPNFIKKKK